MYCKKLNMADIQTMSSAIHFIQVRSIETEKFDRYGVVDKTKHASNNDIHEYLLKIPPWIRNSLDRSLSNLALSKTNANLASCGLDDGDKHKNKIMKYQKLFTTFKSNHHSKITSFNKSYDSIGYLLNNKDDNKDDLSKNIDNSKDALSKNIDNNKDHSLKYKTNELQNNGNSKVALSKNIDNSKDHLLKYKTNESENKILFYGGIFGDYIVRVGQLKESESENRVQIQIIPPKFGEKDNTEQSTSNKSNDFEKNDKNKDTLRIIPLKSEKNFDFDMKCSETLAYLKNCQNNDEKAPLINKFVKNLYKNMPSKNNDFSNEKKLEFVKNWPEEPEEEKQVVEKIDSLKKVNLKNYEECIYMFNKSAAKELEPKNEIYSAVPRINENIYFDRNSSIDFENEKVSFNSDDTSKNNCLKNSEKSDDNGKIITSNFIEEINKFDDRTSEKLTNLIEDCDKPNDNITSNCNEKLYKFDINKTNELTDPIENFMCGDVAEIISSKDNFHIDDCSSNIKETNSKHSALTKYVESFKTDKKQSENSITLNEKAKCENHYETVPSQISKVSKNLINPSELALKNVSLTVNGNRKDNLSVKFDGKTPPEKTAEGYPVVLQLSNLSKIDFNESQKHGLLFLNCSALGGQCVNINLNVDEEKDQTGNNNNISNTNKSNSNNNNNNSNNLKCSRPKQLIENNEKPFIEKVEITTEKKFQYSIPKNLVTEAVQQEYIVTDGKKFENKATIMNKKENEAISAKKLEYIATDTERKETKANNMEKLKINSLSKDVLNSSENRSKAKIKHTSKSLDVLTQNGVYGEHKEKKFNPSLVPNASNSVQSDILLFTDGELNLKIAFEYLNCPKKLKALKKSLRKLSTLDQWVKFVNLILAKKKSSNPQCNQIISELIKLVSEMERKEMNNEFHRRNISPLRRSFETMKKQVLTKQLLKESAIDINRNLSPSNHILTRTTSKGIKTLKKNFLIPDKVNNWQKVKKSNSTETRQSRTKKNTLRRPLILDTIAAEKSKSISSIHGIFQAPATSIDSKTIDKSKSTNIVRSPKQNFQRSQIKTLSTMPSKNTSENQSKPDVKILSDYKCELPKPPRIAPSSTSQVAKVAIPPNINNSVKLRINKNHPCFNDLLKPKPVKSQNSNESIKKLIRPLQNKEAGSFRSYLDQMFAKRKEGLPSSDISNNEALMSSLLYTRDKKQPVFKCPPPPEHKRRPCPPLDEFKKSNSSKKVEICDDSVQSNVSEHNRAKSDCTVTAPSIPTPAALKNKCQTVYDTLKENVAKFKQTFNAGNNKTKSEMRLNRANSEPPTSSKKVCEGNRCGKKSLLKTLQEDQRKKYRKQIPNIRPTKYGVPSYSEFLQSASVQK